MLWQVNVGVIVVDRFSEIKVIGGYIHLLKKDSCLRVTLPISEIVSGYDVVEHGEPVLSKDGLCIEFPDSSCTILPLPISELIPSSATKLGLSDIQQISSADIAGVHPVYLEMLEETGLELIGRSAVEIREEALNLATLVQPLLLHRYKGKIYCFGNIAAYNAAVSSGLDIELWGRFYTKKSAKSFFRSLVITEVYTQQLLSQATSKTPKALYQFQGRVLEHQSFGEEFKRIHTASNSKAKFARYFGVDARSL